MELSATATPSTMLSATGNPQALANKPTIPAVTPTCKPPPISAVRHKCFNSLSENSMPSVNISSTTPISAKLVITGSSLAKPVAHSNPKFPISTPLNRYPTSRLCLNFTSTSEIKTANASTKVNNANSGEIFATPLAINIP